MEIPWDDIVYFDWKGDGQRVIHQNVKYVNRNLPQTPSIVPKDSMVAEHLLPVANVYTTSGFFNSSYAVKSLFPSYKSQDAANKSNLVGQTIKIKFPVVVDGSRKEYLFAFQIEGVLVEKQ